VFSGDMSMFTVIFWQVIGVTAATIFYGRFYIQWLVSEHRGESTIPIVFWYMSVIGSLMLLAYGVYLQSPVGVLSHCFNIIIYTRNLNFIWKERARFTRKQRHALHAVVLLIVLVAMGLVILTWLREYDVTRQAEPSVMRTTWFWIGIGVLGQGFFALRFTIQWIISELKRKSIIPAIFWYISILASTLQLASFVHRGEWVFVAGITATIFVYLRNIWMIKRVGKDVVPNNTPV